MMLDSKKIKVFIDFDGTITKVDVGAEIFLKFGEHDVVYDIVRRIDRGEMNGKEGCKELFKVLPYVPKEKLDLLIDSIEIDESFYGFVEFMRGHELEFWVLSDGFDYYIERIFKRENLEYIRYFSNTLYFEDNVIKTHYKYGDEECKECANCKRNHILLNSADEDYTIYIGNGSSDRCPAQFCDYIFAKDTLLKYCEKERISFSPFNTFSDVVCKMEKILAKKRLRKRHQAELKRRGVYMQG